MADLIKYRIWCETEEAYVYTDFRESVPTVCPNNNGHTIGAYTQYEKRLDNSFKIVHEDDTPVDSDRPLETYENINPRDMWDKVMIHSTPRPPDCDTYITSRGDDRSTAYTTHTYGTGTKLYWSESVIDEYVLYVDFNMEENKTFLHNGWLTCSGADADEVTCEVTNEVTTTGASTDTAFSLYGGYMIVPAASAYGEGEGVGTLTVDGNSTIPTTTTGFKFVQCLTSQKTGIKTPGWWNAEWDTTEKEWKNITPALAGDGDYNLFSVALTLDRFCNHLVLLDSGHTYYLHSMDTAQLGIGMRLKFHLDVYGTPHAVKLAINLYMHREKTI